MPHAERNLRDVSRAPRHQNLKRSAIPTLVSVRLKRFHLLHQFLAVNRTDGWLICDREKHPHRTVARGEGLTAELLCDRMADLYSEGYGPDVEVDRARVGITWAEFGHLYEPFYVYQYATGISGAHALARGVIDGADGAAARYLEFLSAGDSLYPLDALERAGVDLRSPEPVEQTFAVLASLVDRIEALV